MYVYWDLFQTHASLDRGIHCSLSQVGIREQWTAGAQPDPGISGPRHSLQPVAGGHHGRQVHSSAFSSLSRVKVEAKVRAREEGQRLQDSIQVTMLFKVLCGTTDECLGPSSACLAPCSCCPLVLKLSGQMNWGHVRECLSALLHACMNACPLCFPNPPHSFPILPFLCWPLFFHLFLF